MATKQISYDVPDSADLMTEASKAKADASFAAMMIVDDESLQVAVNMMNTIAGRIKELNEIRLSITRPMDAAKKNVMALFKPAIQRLEQAEDEIKRSVTAYRREQERLAAKARREAEAKAEEERQALLAAAKDSNDEIKALALTEVAATIVPDAVDSPAKVAGATFIKRWKGRVVDLPAFLRFVADHPEFADCVTVNQAQINRLIAASKGKVQLNGVEAYEEESVQAR